MSSNGALREAKVVFFALLILISAGWPAGAVAGPAAVSALGKIEAARERGELDRETALVYSVFAVKDPTRLPAEFASDPGAVAECGEEVLARAEAELPALSLSNQRLLALLLQRPALDAYIDTAHFRVHYCTIPGDPNLILGWPDPGYRDAVAAACESVYTREILEMQFDVPPSDGFLGGGENLIDCYVHAMDPGVWGYAVAEGDVPSTPRRDRYGYFALDNDYAGTGYDDPTMPMRDTAAHEFFHLVEYAYDWREGDWAKESCCGWVQDEVFDSLNTGLQWLPEFFSTPWESLTSVEGLREYGSWIWVRYLSENFGYDIVRDIWNRAVDITYGFLRHTTEEIAERGSSLDVEFPEFEVWKYLCGANYAPGHFEEGQDYPDSPRRVHSSYPFQGGPTFRPDRLACNYLEFRHSMELATSLLLGYAGPDASQVRIVTRSWRGLYDDSGAMSLTGGEGSYSVYGWENDTVAVMIPVMESACPPTGNDYTYAARETLQTDVPAVEVPDASLWLGGCSPSPAHQVVGISFRLRAAGAVRLAVYDVSGKQVALLVDGVRAAGMHTITWDGHQDSGEEAASGIYFARLESAGEARSRKIVMAR